ncbi:MAG: twin-arginine translocase subunit TatC [Ardenticatenales bacterium]|nr:twin-arginine translocase subunit TatC [Ardenticatenales bacterium]
MTTATEPDAYQGEAQPLVEHLREFRTRFIIALLAVFVTTLLVMPFTDAALQILISPLENKPQALNPTDALVQWFKVAMVGGISLAIPIILYQIIAFLLPALTRREKRYIFFFLPAATLFFLGGILFGAMVALPVSLSFLQNFGEEFAVIQWTLEAYVSFVTTLLLALGIGFQTPLVIFFLAKLGIVSYQTLIKNVRWAFLASAILSAVLTPTPDPWTMVVVMIPLFLLYLLGVLFARFA